MKKKKICPRCKRPMKKDDELVTKGAVKKTIRKEMNITWGFMCGSHRTVCKNLIKAINNLPSEKRKERAVNEV